MNNYKIYFLHNNGTKDYIYLESENKITAKERAEKLLNFVNNKNFEVEQIMEE